MSDLHVPKLETFDIGARANVDPKGFVRAVDVFEVHPHGLYMARGADHPQFGYLESWLLPSLGLRANIFHFRPGVAATSHRYLDVAEVTWSDGDASDHPTARGATADAMPDAASATVWRTRDLYLDLLVLDGAVHVDDTDELTAAIAAGIVDADAGAWAIDRAFDALAGITAHDGDVDSWLAAAGCPVTWANDVTLVEANQPHPKRVAIGQGPDAPAAEPTR
ncbi:MULTISPECIES: DUF402 domain-containing protein [Corynebacterium]|uniref:DUF402 domain-containing protein n=1 Tax=Corynebacterium TaxID=1716 RepID=UPI0008A61813|nr:MULTISPECIES: DUF402 domain-containing protein [Corynebacterium]MCG7440178.1 DUF402 domain-containing protein [Corynebacterium freneyi]